jgi:hypothetical protein
MQPHGLDAEGIKKWRNETLREMRAARAAIERAGRYHINEAVEKAGYIPVVRVMAATIRHCPDNYDFYPYQMALEIAMPLNKPPTSNLHPAILQEEFLRLMRPNRV